MNNNSAKVKEEKNNTFIIGFCKIQFSALVVWLVKDLKWLKSRPNT